MGAVSNSIIEMNGICFVSHRMHFSLLSAFLFEPALIISQGSVCEKTGYKPRDPMWTANFAEL